MDFRSRLQKAAERGERTRDEKLRQEQAKALSEEECKRLHSNHRLALTEHIEVCLKQLADNIPGFRFETIVDETGWGTAVSRDDIKLAKKHRENYFSRLKLVVSPFNKYHVLELIAKGTIRNRESFSRKNFQRLNEVDEESFHKLIELWVLDYAEMFAAAG
jgi:hypothetical protein